MSADAKQEPTFSELVEKAGCKLVGKAARTVEVPEISSHLTILANGMLATIRAQQISLHSESIIVATDRDFHDPETEERVGRRVEVIPASTSHGGRKDALGFLTIVVSRCDKPEFISSVDHSASKGKKEDWKVVRTFAVDLSARPPKMYKLK